MTLEQRRYWFPKYEDGKKIIFDRFDERVYSTNPVLIATISELVTLMLVSSGFNYSQISSIIDLHKSTVTNDISNLRKANHTESGNLFKKAAKRLGLLNYLALRGLAVQVYNEKRRESLLERISIAEKALNEELRSKTGREPFDIWVNPNPVMTDK